MIKKEGIIVFYPPFSLITFGDCFAVEQIKLIGLPFFERYVNESRCYGVSLYAKGETLQSSSDLW